MCYDVQLGKPVCDQGRSVRCNVKTWRELPPVSDTDHSVLLHQYVSGIEPAGSMPAQFPAMHLVVASLEGHSLTPNFGATQLSACHGLPALPTKFRKQGSERPRQGNFYVSRRPGARMLDYSSPPRLHCWLASRTGFLRCCGGDVNHRHCLIVSAWMLCGVCCMGCCSAQASGSARSGHVKFCSRER